MKQNSIKKFAAFCDAHDVSDFDDELEEVSEPVFVRSARAAAAIRVPLARREAAAIERIAHAKGVSREQLVRECVLRNLPRRRNGRSQTRRRKSA